MHPHVFLLQLRLPEGQIVIFHENDKFASLIDNHILKKTMLTKFFKMNCVDSKART